jgi:poly-gamma-glutamate synthesis protein (capsule biosynthesis protein)
VPSPTPAPITLALAEGLPDSLVEALEPALATLRLGPEQRPVALAAAGTTSDARLLTAPLAPLLAQAEAAPGHLLTQRYYAVVAPFADLRDDVALAELQARWAGQDEALLLMTRGTAEELVPLWGQGGVEPVADEVLAARLSATEGALALVPFERLDPTLKVLTVEGVSVLSNSLDAAQYPLALALVVEGDAAETLAPSLEPVAAAWGNRDPDYLTQLIMTGVTAMCRLTAERMERYGVLYLTLVISDVLRAADITHVSNEVPFIQGCPVDTRANNLVFCSDYTYWGALEAIGTDIVGLSGNHVNDHGYDGARESIAFYRDRDIPAYGSGLNTDEACAPLRWEHNGNTMAFIATLAFEPSYAWARPDKPGTCYFYEEKERLKDTIRSLKAEGVDIVAIELQYLETYNPFPTGQQVDEFRELRAAGADIVTGVQSHVPQAWEPYGQGDEGGPGIIVYGLGNLFFDQMWSWETRTGLIARHTIYKGKVISSEILTTVLEDAAQPRWATAEERAEILDRIHSAAPKRP